MELAVSLSGQIWLGEVDDITINETGEAGVIKAGAKEVTKEAISAVFEHMARKEGFIEDGFAGYVFTDEKGKEYCLMAFDTEKYKLVKAK